LCFFLIKSEAPLRLIDEKRSWVNANETTTSNQLVLNQIADHSESQGCSNPTLLRQKKIY
jgi:hypothetical protein